MKILHCIFSFNAGGAETMLVDIINEQVKINKVTLFVINKSCNLSLLNTIDKRAKVKCFNRKEGSRSIFPILKLNYYIWKLNPDAVHLHSYSLVNAIRIPHLKIYFTAHCLNIPEFYFKRFNKLFAISEAVKRDIQSKGNYEVEVIANGINSSKIRVKSNCCLENEFKIIQVGRLDCSLKGQNILIQALDIVIHKYLISDITVDFIGTGDSLEELQQLAKNLNIEKHVNFLGLRDRNYIYSHLCNYDVMCHPSRYEGFGLVVAEGMAAKIPVLVATGDGPFEIIGKGEYGYYFERENVEDCASKIVDIYQNYENRSMIVEKAYQHVLEEYSVQKTAQRYLEEYL